MGLTNTTTATRERPIIMTGESVRAILDGRKTATRRVVKPQPVDIDECGPYRQVPIVDRGLTFMDRHHIACPYGAVGDRLWVRENWGYVEGQPERYYQADAIESTWPVERWRPSIHMPRAWSRLTLEITAVRVERLQAITEDDARAEGVEREFEVTLATFTNGSLHTIDRASTYLLGYKHAWDEINQKRGYPWSSNPWVWVVSFRPV
jgi:hypothetical protein